MDRLTFDQLFRALPSPHMILDRELVFSAVNDAYEKATNRPRHDLVGRKVFDCFPNDGPGRARLETSIQSVFETGKADSIAFIEYEIPRSANPLDGFERRYWSAIHTPLRDEAGQVIFVLQNTVDITELMQLRAAAGGNGMVPVSELALVQRAREIEEAYRASRSQLDKFKHLFEQAPGMVALLRGSDHVFTFANRAYRALTGDRELVGLPSRDVFPDSEVRGLTDLLDRVYQTGEPVSGNSLRVFVRDAHGALRELFLDITFHPIRDDAGGIEGIFVQGYDRTESVRAHHRQRLLIDELNHRVKNTLSMIQSLARPSFRADKDREEARRSFEARIVTLSNAHNLLSERHWESAEIGTILRVELAALDVDRVELVGPPSTLNPKAAIALAMVFHELASNAIKYGALNSPEGRLRVSWDKQKEATIVRWDETWKTSDVSIKPGFGMRMLERIVTGELEGRLRADMRADGLSWTIEIPSIELEDIPQLVLR